MATTITMPKTGRTKPVCVLSAEHLPIVRMALATLAEVYAGIPGPTHDQANELLAKLPKAEA